MKLEFIQRDILKEKPKDETKLGFGRIFTDYMLMMKRDGQRGWYYAAIEPYGNLSLSPAATVLHYSQEVFEGLKVVSYTHLDVYKRQRLHISAGRWRSWNFRPEASMWSSARWHFIICLLYTSTQHLENRVQEIKDGTFNELMEALMGKPVEELKELYNNREIEK